MSSQNSGSFIEIKNISKIFGNTSAEALEAITKKNISKQDALEKYNSVIGVSDVSFDINPGEIFCVMGLSGSGKSSLAFDTIYAEGQRRYAESLSAYARQFMMRMDKPDVDHIAGLCPAVAIEQKVITRTPRSTVGSMTEIYDYMRLLFARVGKTYSPISGNEVKKDDVRDVLDFIKKCKAGDKLYLLSPFPMGSKRKPAEELGILMQKGFSRLYDNSAGEILQLEELVEEKKWKPTRQKLTLQDLVARKGSRMCIVPTLM